MGRWFHTHTHSKYSVLDGMTNVQGLVRKAVLMGQPAISLTDHGNMAGTVWLYKAAKAEGILPFPGFEGYLLDPFADDLMDSKTERFHFGLQARNLRGYHGLVGLISLGHTRPRFSRYPRHTIADLAGFAKEYGDDVIFTTGCFFGLLQQTIVKNPSKAIKVARTFATMFPHTIVELQHHNINDETHNDDEMVGTLVGIADNLGLPFMATQDCHYEDQKQRSAHALMKRMVYSSGETNEFPGDSFHFASEDWVAEHYDKRVWNRVLETADHLVSLNELSIPPLDKFQVHMPSMAKAPNKRLRAICMEWLAEFTQGMKPAKALRYEKRMEEELSVIADTGMANYFLIWRKCVRWCRLQKIAIEARGSGNGSLVNFAIGVTQVDPIKWGVSYERFISRDRLKPPDIDMDIEDARRQEVINWLKAQFECVQISTWGKLGTSINSDGEETGSVFVSYMGMLRRKCAEEAAAYVERKGLKKGDTARIAGAFFNKRYSQIESMADIARLSHSDHLALQRMAAMRSVFKSYGVHAGGVLLAAPDMAIKDWVPTMLVASSDTRVSQYDMDAVEELGLLKMDWLGQATLAVMRICQELMGREDPCDFTWIPDNDNAACKILRSGQRDNGVFHFEAPTKSKGGRELGVRTTKDAIIATAAYMPGCVDSGQKDLYIETRRNPAKKRKMMSAAEDHHPVVAEVLAETNGVMVFQEQPLQILRKLGMSVANVNLMYKTLKDSGAGAVERNRKRLEELRKEYDRLAEEQGVEDADTLWNAVTGFMAYGFNKAHSAGYGLRSYRCAYLKAHYPLEFMTALLTVWGGRDKETLYIREARRIGIRLASPDINVSGFSWSLDRNAKAIRKGLLSIKGIGDKAAMEIAAKAPYKDIRDLVSRVSGRSISGGARFLKEGVMSGKLRDLDDAGALNSLKEG